MRLRRSTKLLLPLLVFCIAMWIVSYYRIAGVWVQPVQHYYVGPFIHRGLVGASVDRFVLQSPERFGASFQRYDEHTRDIPPDKRGNLLGFSIFHTNRGFVESYGFYCPWWFVTALMLALLLTLELRSRRRAPFVTAPAASPG